MAKKRLIGISPETAFWGVMALLFISSCYFTYRVQARRRIVRGKNTQVANNAQVQPIQAIDGDEVSIKVAGSPLVVRLIGIKAFSPSTNEPDIKAEGLSAKRALNQLIKSAPLRVEYTSFKKDKHGRLLGYLRAGDVDVAQALVRKGLVMVFTRYPFPRQADYLTAEGKARASQLGLWANPRATERATTLKALWEAEQ
ncbi:MAG: thermonuclease family protein [Deltaproteobacteria bacterium]|nr:thermonuclease family protein [Deltaproteobacteria bacterium]